MLELQVTRTTDIFILSLCIAVWFQILTSLPSYWRNWMIFCVITVEYFSWNHIPLGLHVWESRRVQRSIGESGELRSAPISYQSQVSWVVSLPLSLIPWSDLCHYEDGDTYAFLTVPGLISLSSPHFNLFHFLHPAFPLQAKDCLASHPATHRLRADRLQDCPRCQ